MQKVYLLLRDNRESGPFTIDELWQQHLQPGDLIWVEGKSHAWAPLNEMLLSPVVEEGPVQDPAEATLIKRPLTTEEKAEALRKRAMNFKQVVDFKTIENTGPVQPGHFHREDSIDFIDHRKDKYSRQAEVLTGGFFALLVIGGLFYGRNLIRENKDVPTSVTTQIISGESNTAKVGKDTVNTVRMTPDTLAQSASLVTLKPKKIINKAPDTSRVAETKPAVPEKPADTPRKEETQAKPVVAPVQVEPQEKKELVVETPKETPTANDEKKKTLGQAIKGLFKKKKNKNKEDQD